MNYYQRLRDLREDKDLNQTQLAIVIGTSQSYYAQYENGKRQIPFDRIIELAKFYNVSTDYIAGLTNDKRKFWWGVKKMNFQALLNANNPLSEIIILIILGAIIVFPIMLIVAFFNISTNTSRMTKQLELLNKQMDYLLQMKEYEINNMQGWKPQKPNDIEINEKK